MTRLKVYGDSNSGNCLKVKWTLDYLAAGTFLVGERVTLSDIALVAYTRMAPDGGLNLDGYPAVLAWIARVEAALNIRD